MFNYTTTPSPRELSEEERKEFHLYYYGGKPILPLYQDTGNVWITYDTGKLPVYSFYNRGTNDLLILKYNWEQDKWTSVEIETIPYLKSLLWKMLVGKGFKMTEEKETISVQKCSACSQSHVNLELRTLEEPVRIKNHTFVCYVVCPNTNKILYVRQY